MEYNLEDHRIKAGFAAVGLAIVLFPIVLYKFTGQTGVNIFSVIISSLLTLALVVLYFQQASIADMQTKLLKKDYQSALVKQGRVIAEKDSVRFEMRNVGRGKVRSIHLRSEVTSDTGSVDVEFGRSRVKSVDDGSFVVEPESDWKEYEGDVVFRIPSIETIDDDRHLPFRMLTKQLSLTEVDKIRLKLTLEIRDEGLIEDEFSDRVVIAEQEIEVPSSETKEIDGELKETPVSARLEEAVGPGFSSTQDINAVSLSELAESHDIIDAE